MPASRLESLSGVIPPVMVPFAEGEVDHDSLRRQVRLLLDAGASGLWVNGTTGEFYGLTEGERSEVVETVARESSGKAVVIAQIGDTSTRTAARNCRGALEAGADEIAAVAPYYVDFAQDELVEYYRALATVAGRPMMVYHLPQMAKVSLTAESILTLAREGAVLGLKESSGDLDWYRALIDSLDGERLPLRHFVGRGVQLDLGLFIGSHGAMCAIATLVPMHSARMVAAAAAGDWPALRSLGNDLARVNASLRVPGRGNWAVTVAVMKHLLWRRGVISTPDVAAPLAPLSTQDGAMLDRVALPLVNELEGVKATI